MGLFFFQARTTANMYFDLSRFKDFSLKFPEADDEGDTFESISL